MSKTATTVTHPEGDNEKSQLYLQKFEASELSKITELLSKGKPVSLDELENGLKKATDKRQHMNDVLTDRHKWHSDLSKALTKVRTHKQRLENEKKNLISITSTLIAIKQQEKNLESICSLYSDLTNLDPKPETKSCVYLENEKNEKVLFSVNEMEESVISLQLKVSHLDKDMHLVEANERIVENAMNQSKTNYMVTLNYGSQRNLVDKTAHLPIVTEKAMHSKETIRMDDKSDKSEKTDKNLNGIHNKV